MFLDSYSGVAGAIDGAVGVGDGFQLTFDTQRNKPYHTLHMHYSWLLAALVVSICEDAAAHGRWCLLHRPRKLSSGTSTGINIMFKNKYATTVLFSCSSQTA